MAGIKEQDYAAMELLLKQQMDDIIDQAFPGHRLTEDLKRFTIHCEKTAMTALGQCRHWFDGSSRIRLMNIENERWNHVLRTCIHEVAHHVTHVIAGATKSSHDAFFYAYFKRLLTAALDMGILDIEDLWNWEDNNSSSRKKVARIMEDYVPHPVEYRMAANYSIRAYNAREFEDVLSDMGYTWQSIDSAWVRSVSAQALTRETDELRSLGIADEDIVTVSSAAVITRLRKTVRVLYAGADARETLLYYGYSLSKDRRCWEKSIAGDDIPEQERTDISAFPEIVIKISGKSQQYLHNKPNKALAVKTPKSGKNLFDSAIQNDEIID